MSDVVRPSLNRPKRPIDDHSVVITSTTLKRPIYSGQIKNSH